MAGIIGLSLYRYLQEQNFPLPDECCSVELKIEPNEPMKVIYTCNLSGETLEMLSSALLKMARDCQ